MFQAVWEQFVGRHRPILGCAVGNSSNQTKRAASPAIWRLCLLKFLLYCMRYQVVTLPSGPSARCEICGQCHYQYKDEQVGRLQSNTTIKFEDSTTNCSAGAVHFVPQLQEAWTTKGSYFSVTLYQILKFYAILLLTSDTICRWSKVYKLYDYDLFISKICL